MPDPLDHAMHLHQSGRLAEAERLYRQILDTNPDNPQALHLLGVLAAQTGHPEAAIPLIQRAIHLHPLEAMFHNNLGLALQRLHQSADAAAAYRRAIELDSDYPDPHCNLATLQRDLGDFDAATESYRAALTRKPAYPEALHNLATMIADLGQLAEALTLLRQALAVSPNMYTHSNLIYLMHFDPNSDDRAIAAELARWNQQYAAPLAPQNPTFPNDRAPDRRLRLGYVSPEFYAHAESHFILPLLRAHDHSQFQIHCYSSTIHHDTITAALRQCADTWHEVAGLSDEALAAQIRADGIDILIDLSMHMHNHRLLTFARKSAPLQITWLAYPGSTGLPQIDYRLTDPHLTPLDTSAPPASLSPQHSALSTSSERPLTLPDSWCCYDPLSDAPPSRNLPFHTAGRITFGCLQTFRKINPQVLALWADLLLAIPNSHLILQTPRGLHRERTLLTFQSRGLNPDRIQFLPPMPRPDYLTQYHNLDIALDPFPYNGITTTCDALWMGVPVLTLTGPTACARAGQSLLTTIGLTDWIAYSPEDFITKATTFAANLPHLAHLHATLRQRMIASPLMNAPRFARNFESALRTAWQSWCVPPSKPH